MKRMSFIALLISGVLVSKAQTMPAEQLANKVAQKMKDTLSLTAAQKDTIYQLNVQLHVQKLAARGQYSNRDSLTSKLQVIENSRDSLYSMHLSTSQYQLYKTKKRNIVNNN